MQARLYQAKKEKKTIRQLDDKNLQLFRGRIIKEPSPEDIDEIVDEYKHANIDVVVAIGGGSVLDAGKAVSAMLPLKDKVINYLEGIGTKSHPGYKLPFIALPTTSGTGSETTKNAVISKVGEGGFKKSLRHDNFIPDLAIVDPEFSLNCPSDITAASGMDAFSQLLESYLSTHSNIMTDALALAGIKRIKKSLLKAYINPLDIEAKADVAYAAMLSGICLANAGLGLVHGFASSAGALIDVPHGILCGRLVSIANKLTLEKLLNENPDSVAIKKYNLLAKLFTGKSFPSKQDGAKAFINFLEEYTNSFNLPGLGSYGMTENLIDKIVEETSQKYNPVKLSSQQLSTLLLESL